MYVCMYVWIFSSLGLLRYMISVFMGDALAICSYFSRIAGQPYDCEFVPGPCTVVPQDLLSILAYFIAASYYICHYHN